MQSIAVKEDKAAFFMIPNALCALGLLLAGAHTPTDCIRRLVEQSAGRIEIAAGGGVDEATVAELGMPLLLCHRAFASLTVTTGQFSHQRNHFET